MKIDCLSCTQKPLACNDCVVTLLMELPAGNIEISTAEQEALEVMAKAGLVPHLRLVTEVRSEDLSQRAV